MELFGTWDICQTATKIGHISGIVIMQLTQMQILSKVSWWYFFHVVTWNNQQTCGFFSL